MAHQDAPPGDDLKADERTRRILDAAVHLAEAGGFAAVRLRDVAQTSGVALGTLYKRFRSKEDLLVGVLSQELRDLRGQLAERPVQGPTPLVRVVGFFRFLTDFLCHRPNLGRAVVRSAASGEQALSERMSRFHADLFELSFTAMLGGPDRGPTPGEAVMLSALQQVWFSALCGWAGSLYDPGEVGNQVAAAARLMTHGVDRWPAESAADASPLQVWSLPADPQGGRAVAASEALQQGEAAVNFVVADAGARVQDLLARADVDVIELGVAIAGEAWPVAAGSPPTGRRPRIVVLADGFDAEVAARLAQQVDAVFGWEASLAGEQARGCTQRLYLALARGASLRDAFDEARKGAELDDAVRLVARPGADLRALSLR